MRNGSPETRNAWTLTPLASLLLGAVALAQEPPATAPSAAAAPEPGKAESRPAEEKSPKKLEVAGVQLDGSMELRYRYRSTTSDWADQDLFASWGIRGFVPGVGEKGLTLNYQGAAVLDLDAFKDLGNPFFGLPETWAERIHAYTYELYGEFDPGGSIVGDLRIGRQILWRETSIRFDGVYAETPRIGQFEFQAYGGVPVHYYESQPDGDLVGGVGAKYHPSRALAISLDEIYVRDRRYYPGIPSVTDDVLSTLTADWRPNEMWTVRGMGSLLGTAWQKGTLDATFVDATAGIRVTGRFVQQSEYTEFPVTEFSPFIGVEGYYAPYIQEHLDASWSIGKLLEIGAGVQARELINGAEEALYNHEFVHYYGNATLTPIPDNQLYFTVRADGYQTNDFGTFSGFGASIEKRWDKQSRIEVGTDYALYRIDYTTGNENFDDRVYYARARIPLTKAITLGVGYRFEEDGIDSYNVADAFLNFRF